MCFPVVPFVFLLLGISGAQTQEDSPAIRDDAPVAQIVDLLAKRHGVGKVADPWKCGIVEYKATGILPGDGKANITEHFEFPDCFKRKAVADTPEGPLDLTFVVNAKGAWVISPGKPTKEIPREMDSRQRHRFADLSDVSYLVDNASHAMLVERTQFDGKAVVHLRLETEEFGRGEFFVDVMSGTLAGTSKQAQDPLTGADATIVSRLRDYKIIDGVLVPMKFSITSDAKTLLEVEIAKIEFKESLPESTFEKPN